MGKKGKRKTDLGGGTVIDAGGSEAGPEVFGERATKTRKDEESKEGFVSTSLSCFRSFELS
jgi:hypothetical protein